MIFLIENIIIDDTSLLLYNLRQQNLPRFPYEQRTRAGLRFLYPKSIMTYTKQALPIEEQTVLSLQMIHYCS